MNVTKFRQFLEQQYRQWDRGQGQSYKEFARWLGIPPTSLSNWLNSGYTPGKGSIAQLVEKLGPGVYDALGLSRPPEYSVLEEEALPSELRVLLREIASVIESRDLDPESPEAARISSEMLDVWLSRRKVN